MSEEHELTAEEKEAAAFLEKIKSLTFGTGAKAPPCPSCGKQHKLAGVLVQIRIERRRKPPEQSSLAE
ncbi:MAG TPA: hypothetical protein VHA37_04410 [Candidatus Saccharimonadales bacterium]|nr:hypothetical protein [Candidatus Saccharimonadales bacterium]